MQVPLQVVFKNMDHSDAVEAAIRERVGRLERLADDLVSCRVTVAAPHKHHRKGNTYQVSVDLHVPGGEVVITRDPGRNHAHEDVLVAIRDAMNAAARRLEDHVRIRSQIQRPVAPAHGRVAQIIAAEDYGRIDSADGRSIYFHRNSLVDAKLEDLSIGTEVRFAEEAGDSGPQASWVRLAGKQYVAG